MEGDSPNRGQIVKRILEREDLPSDLLDRATNMPEAQEGHLFEWVMELREILDDEAEGVVGDVLSDGVLVSTAGSAVISREAATLTETTRSALQEEMKEESQYLEQATFVLALDVQNRVHNEVSQS